MDRTFAFVDLAGFTALTEVHGDQIAVDHVDRFVGLAAEAAEGHGELVKSIGDAVMLCSPTPSDGVEAVVELMSRCRGTEGLPLMRAGLHHGSAIARDHDWIGGAVNVAARIADSAEAGQILFSESVNRALPSTARAVSLGFHSFKNLAQPMEVFELQMKLPAARGVVDPVCRMGLMPGVEVVSLRHHGQDFWFCSPRCARTFEAHPARYGADP